MTSRLSSEKSPAIRVVSVNTCSRMEQCGSRSRVHWRQDRFVRIIRKGFDTRALQDSLRRSLTDLDLPTLYLVTSIALATITITIIFLGLPGKILRWRRPVTISSPVFKVSQFGLLTEHEFPVDLDKQLKGVPIFLHNRGARRCIIQALWLQPHGNRAPRLSPRLPLIVTYKDSEAIDSGHDVELRVFPETPSYLERICKSWETEFCQIYASCPPYPVARSRRFLYTNWGYYIYQIFYGATKRTASALVQMAARENKTPAETLNLLLEHYGRLIPIPLTSLVYSQMTLNEEVAKQTVPQAYSDYANTIVDQTLVKPARDAYERMMREEGSSTDKIPEDTHRKRAG